MFYVQYNTEWYQGDILKTFPFIVGDLAPTNPSKSLKLFEAPAIVITQTCDLVDNRRPFAQVCPILDFVTLKTKLVAEGRSEQGANDAIASVRRSRTEYRFYIPSDESKGIKEGYVDLNFINTVSNKQLKQQERLATLGDHPRQIFAYFIANTFLKPHIN